MSARQSRLRGRESYHETRTAIQARLDLQSRGAEHEVDELAAVGGGGCRRDWRGRRRRRRCWFGEAAAGWAVSSCREREGGGEKGRIPSLGRLLLGLRLFYSIVLAKQKQTSPTVFQTKFIILDFSTIIIIIIIIYFSCFINATTCVVVLF
ncbi:hypothetical protein GQ55_2G004300 [Panicum hallii var. hallii]|uniref:Uncharacterized protein n=1 Tax=Panicum hallii var. hallii TaxID=1504633 RepID=A0A2T7EK08_9POAL|nr:hypothetical protein GQ55_2G004300 [Panicum hallii var. hallii]